MGSRTCVTCNKPLPGENPSRIYCSTKCRVLSYQKRKEQKRICVALYERYGNDKTIEIVKVCDIDLRTYKQAIAESIAEDMVA